MRNGENQTTRGRIYVSKDLYIVAYEGDDRSVVNYAAERAKRDGATLRIVHVLEWSPYSFLTPEEIEQRHVHRREEIARATEMVMDPVLNDLRGKGIEADGEIRHGSVVDLLIEIATEHKAEMIFVGRSSASSISARVFGSVPLGLVQSAPVPVVIVP
jgi:nucleotide-binding universal stress UspA family protein